MIWREEKGGGVAKEKSLKYAELQFSLSTVHNIQPVENLLVTLTVVIKSFSRYRAKM